MRDWFGVLGVDLHDIGSTVCFSIIHNELETITASAINDKCRLYTRWGIDLGCASLWSCDEAPRETEELSVLVGGATPIEMDNRRNSFCLGWTGIRRWPMVAGLGWDDQNFLNVREYAFKTSFE